MTVLPQGLDFRRRDVCFRRLADMGIPMYIGTCTWVFSFSSPRASGLTHAARRSHLSVASAMACTQRESGAGAENAHEPDSNAKCVQNSTSNNCGALSIMDSHLLARSLERSLSISNVDWPDWRI